MTHHEGNATGIGAEIHRSQIGITRDQPDVEGIDPEHLRHQIGQDVVGALANFGGTAECGDAARTVQLKLHSGVWQGVPVDGKSRTAQIRGAGESDAVAESKFTVLVLPA